MSDTPKSRKRGGLMVGVVFVALGVFVLLRNLGAFEDPWEFYGRYWPALLMLMGLCKIAEFLLGTSGRMIRFGEFVLIVLVILSGLLVSTLPVRLRLPIGGRRIAVRDYYGSSFTFTDEKAQPLPPNMMLAVKNSQGSVVLVPGIDGQIRIKLQKIVYARTENEAKKVADRIRLVLNSSSDRLSAEVNRDAFDRQEGRFETSFEIAVPPTLAVDISNSNGDVSLEGLTGNQRISTSYGRLTLNRLRGDLILTNKYGDTRISSINGNVRLDAVRSESIIDDITGDLEVTNAYAPIDASNISGKARLVSSYSRIEANRIKRELTIEGPGCEVAVDSVEGPVKITSSHKEVTIDDALSSVDLQQDYGSIRATNIGAGLTAKLNYSGLTASRINGPVDIGSVNSEVELEGVRGDAIIRNKYKSITVSDFSGSIDITNENAPVTLSATASPQKAITAVTSSAAIVFSLPDGSPFSLEASTRGGSFESDFDSLKPVRSGSDSITINGQSGSGGPLIKLQNRYGDLQIRKSSPK